MHFYLSIVTSTMISGVEEPHSFLWILKYRLLTHWVRKSDNKCAKDRILRAQSPKSRTTLCRRKFQERIQRKFREFLKKKNNNFSNRNLNGILIFARVARNIDGDFEDDYFSKLLACEYNPWKIDIMQNLHFVWFRERRMLHKLKKKFNWLPQNI